MKLLADTSALLALALRDDRNHGAAAAFLRASPRARFLLTDLILAELVTRLAAGAGARCAVESAEGLLASQRFELIFLDAEILRGALSQMSRFEDKRLSLTDAASFETIQRLGLDGAFSFDRDFRDCGFRMHP